MKQNYLTNITQSYIQNMNVHQQKKLKTQKSIYKCGKEKNTSHYREYLNVQAKARQDRPTKEKKQNKTVR